MPNIHHPFVQFNSLSYKHTYTHKHNGSIVYVCFSDRLHSFGRLFSCRTVAFFSPSEASRMRVNSIGSSFESVVIECDCVLQIVDFATSKFFLLNKNKSKCDNFLVELIKTGSSLKRNFEHFL